MFMVCIEKLEIRHIVTNINLVVFVNHEEGLRENNRTQIRFIIGTMDILDLQPKYDQVLCFK